MSNTVLTILKRNYKGKEMVFRFNPITGISEVRINEIAEFCNWTTVATSGNECIRWNRVNGFLKELGFSHLVGKDDFIPEYIMYPLIGKAKNNNATEFMIWVGQVLSELRTKGVVIMDNATDESIDFEKKYGSYRIRKTFANSENIKEDYKQFCELSFTENKAKRLTNVERVKLNSIIADSLNNRIQENILNYKPSEIIAMQEFIGEIKNNMLKLANNGNGGEKTGMKKYIKQLEGKIKSLEKQTKAI